MKSEADAGRTSKEERKIELYVPFTTIFKVIAAGLLIFVAIKLLPVAILIFLGLILAVSFHPVIQKIHSWGLPRGIGIALVAIAMIGLIALVALVLIPSMLSQVTILIKGFPKLRTDMLAHLPNTGGLKQQVQELLDNFKLPEANDLVSNAISLAGVALEGVSKFVLILVFSIYFLIDGEKAFQWVIDFFSAPTRTKLKTTAQETSKVVLGYVGCQAVTSTLGTLYAYGVLSLLHVPIALTLAVFAGIFDVIPIIGFFLSVIPAILLGLTVKPETALFVFALYLLYHVLENYFIVPFIYGTRLKISPLVILIALLVAGTLGGILVAIAALPVAASYPILERIWLVKYLGRQVVEKHSEELTEKDTGPTTHPAKSELAPEH